MTNVTRLGTAMLLAALSIGLAGSQNAHAGDNPQLFMDDYEKWRDENPHPGIAVPTRGPVDPGATPDGVYRRASAPELRPGTPPRRPHEPELEADEERKRQLEATLRTWKGRLEHEIEELEQTARRGVKGKVDGRTREAKRLAKLNTSLGILNAFDRGMKGVQWAVDAQELLGIFSDDLEASTQAKYAWQEKVQEVVLDKVVDWAATVTRGEAALLIGLLDPSPIGFKQEENLVRLRRGIENPDRWAADKQAMLRDIKALYGALPPDQKVHVLLEDHVNIEALEQRVSADLAAERAHPRPLPNPRPNPRTPHP